MSIIGAAGLFDLANLSKPVTAEERARIDNILQGLSNEPNKMVEAFKKSPAKGLLSLAHCWAYNSDAFPNDVILKTFVYHTDGAKVPKANKPPVEDDVSERAWACFIGLGSKFVSDNRDFRARLIAAWPGIFKWARYFYTQRVSKLDNTDDIRENIDVICQVISQLIQNNKEVLAVVRRTQGIATFFTKLWVHSAAPPIVVSFIMHTLFHDATLDEIAAIAGNDAEKLIVAQVAVDRLRAAIKESPMQPLKVSRT
ncbi:hypothetical protein R3P38DRAFT_3265883, partial [Favolaschia claudopus]